MNVNILPLKIIGLNCRENSILSLVNWYAGSYTLSLIGSYGVTYMKPILNDTIGDKIHSDKCNIITNSLKYYGIAINTVKKVDSNTVLKVLTNKLQKGIPLIISIDAYNCPWEPDYKSRHSSHWCTVIGTDQNNNFICMDSLPLISETLLPYSDFINGCSGYIDFILSNTNKETINIKQLLLEHTMNDKYTNQLKEFANDLSKCNKIEAEFDRYQYLWDIPLLNNITDIYGRRNQIYNLLLSLNDKSIYANTAINQFKKIVDKWAIIRGLSYKIAMQKSKKANIKKLSEMITDAADLENSINNILIELANNSKTSTDNLEFNTNQSIAYKYLDINKYFNNKAFGNNASFTQTGQYFLTDRLPADNIWNIDDMKFSFPILNDSGFDNISCLGQKITLPDFKFTSIDLLGCSEWGDFSSTILLHHHDNSEELLEIGFTDWCSDPIYQESIAWYGNFKEKSNCKTVMVGRLFAKSYSVKYDNTIDYIIIPNCKNMHIFAITLTNYNLKNIKKE